MRGEKKASAAPYLVVNVDVLYCIIVSWTDRLLAGTLTSLSLISPPLLPPSSCVLFPSASLLFLVF